MPGGRPTKYNDEILEKSYAYINDYNTKYDDMIPSVEGLAEVLEISRITIYDWAKQESKAEFSNMLEILSAKQKKVLMNNGLSGEFNSNITKLVLTQHGMSDKVETTGTFHIDIPKLDASTL